MFNLFKKKTELEKLKIEYRQLLDEAYQLSTTNRTLSDAKTVEANEVLNRIETIESKG